MLPKNENQERCYERAAAGSARTAPAALRNRSAIAEVLQTCLPMQGTVLEVASGTGEHALCFAKLFPHLLWQPSDTHSDALASIAAWRADGPENLLAPLKIDVCEAVWPVSQVAQMICINMIHISPWDATLGLLAGAERVLQPGASLMIYGAFRRRGFALEDSNEAFDMDLKRRNPNWGLRWLEDVVEVAGAHELKLQRVVKMPANNLSVIFKRR